MATMTAALTALLFGAVLLLLQGPAEATDAHRHRAHDGGRGHAAAAAADTLPEVLDVSQDVEEAPCATDVADVSGESVMIARCRATCLQKFSTSSSDASVQRTSHSDSMMCWEYCGKLRKGPKTLASVCKDEYLCWAGCRAACDFHFPDGLLGAGPGSEGRWSLRPTSEASSSAPPRALPPPRFDADGLVLRWRQPAAELHDAASTSAVTTPADAQSTTTAAPEVAQALRALTRTLGEQDDDEGTAAVVFIVTAKMTTSGGWKELKQTMDNWLELSVASRAAMRGVSVLAVAADGPVARASACVPPLPHQDARQDDQDYYDEDASDEDEDDDDAPAGAAGRAAPDGSLQRLAQRSFAQLRGTVQHGVLLRALLRDRAATKQLVEEAAEEEGDDDQDDDEDEEEVLIGQHRLDLVHRLLGVPRGRGGGHRDKAAKNKTGWGLHLVGVWAAGGGARLPRARVAWTAPRSVSETLINWAVPALRISGSRVVSGVSQAEVPLVEQHATRVTVGDAHSSDTSPALVLQLSVQTDASAAAAAVPEPYASVYSRRKAEAPVAVPAGTSSASSDTLRPAYEQAALWEATLVAVGLVVGAAALCVALLLVTYGVHVRIARCCRGRHSSIHAKSASVEPLNAPDQNNV